MGGGDWGLVGEGGTGGGESVGWRGHGGITQKLRGDMEPDFSLDGVLTWVGWVTGTSVGSLARPSHTWPLGEGVAGRGPSCYLTDGLGPQRVAQCHRGGHLAACLIEVPSGGPPAIPSHLQLASNHGASPPAAATGRPTWTGPSVTWGRAQPAGGALPTALGADKGQGTAS